MRRLTFLLVLVVLGAVLAGCGTPPPLISDKYLSDTSLVSQEPCGPPCFAGITVGQTTFADALKAVRDNGAFSNVQSQDDPPQAAWAASSGEACCQMTANPETKVIDAILVRLAPGVKLGDVIAKYGDPEYVSVLEQDYTADETAMGLVYPKSGNVLWIVPGKPTDSVDENDPVVIALYFDPAKFDELLNTATLVKWQGYGPYSDYRALTPVVTPKASLTATPQ